ncbi:MAG: YgiT-type zinc finger protein [Thermoguttaceae bacterium]
MEQESQQPESQLSRQSPGPPVCDRCGGATEREVVQAAFWGGRGWTIIEDIPACVCRQCGERFYDDQTAGKIERLVSGGLCRPTREIVVPVFSLSEAER